MHYRSQRRSVLFTAPGLIVGALAIGAAGGISVSPGDILALVEKPHLLVAVLFVGAFTGIMVEQALSRMRRQDGARGTARAGRNSARRRMPS
ncbi:hypothetical 9.6 kDa integral membrane protein (plasmid) [Sinorhizobium fredii NGR234]|uniref:Uncharacterized protein y4bH n=1 Tax=Sinorhizobium fredii (strain NBRC 101917 / NGR234) TaxID=394 RepID=Y4BH_SINFN|nr:RecName: Full=Uncharacterized protein y4bH [Sinorhizobium fredii NGR234]AAB91623.1 hypothetical 9.6 kDa integral membrane protein [Sinorhizobium fredii NGR234]